MKEICQKIYALIKSEAGSAGTLSVRDICSRLQIRSTSTAHRYLNEGFSGGEKKRNEILQMKLLQPKFALLDEIDSGLDVDAINTIASVIDDLHQKGMSFLVVSHYARLYDLIHPTHSAIMINGKIVLEGDKTLIDRVDKEGYEFLKREHGIDIAKEEKKMNTVSLGACAVNQGTK